MSTEFPEIRTGAAFAPGRGMLTNPGNVNDLTSAIIAAAIRVHQEVGPGLLEPSIRSACFSRLRARGLIVAERIPVPLTYRGRTLVTSYQLDLLIDDKVIVEIKAVACLAPVHKAQLLTYLKLTGRPAGLLINFNVPVLKEGVRRLVNPSLARTKAPSVTVSHTTA